VIVRVERGDASVYKKFITHSKKYAAHDGTTISRRRRVQIEKAPDIKQARVCWKAPGTPSPATAAVRPARP